jgi:hypothetical protein
MTFAAVTSFLALAADTTTTTTVTHLTGSDKAWSIFIVAAFILIAGVVVIVGRTWLEGDRVDRPTETRPNGGPKQRRVPGANSDKTLIRSWLAISLAGGLLIFAAISFWIDDTTLRSTLIGGLVANAGAAIAFYFASKSSDQARQDILAASLPSTVVPNLLGKTLADAQGLLAATPLRLEVNTPQPKDGAQVIAQHPAAQQLAVQGSPVAVTLAGPVPDITGLTADAAETALKDNGLELGSPKPADATWTVTAGTQDPAKDGTVPLDKKVKANFAAPP